MEPKLTWTKTEGGYRPLRALTPDTYVLYEPDENELSFHFTDRKLEVDLQPLEKLEEEEDIAVTLPLQLISSRDVLEHAPIMLKFHFLPRAGLVSYETSPDSGLMVGGWNPGDEKGTQRLEFWGKSEELAYEVSLRALYKSENTLLVNTPHMRYVFDLILGISAEDEKGLEQYFILYGNLTWELPRE